MTTFLQQVMSQHRVIKFLDLKTINKAKHFCKFEAVFHS